MNDRYGRKIDYIRISVTDRCNLRCVYCMPESGVTPLRHGEILTYEELLRLCRLMAQMGIRKVKLTGGEPLIRKDLSLLVAGLKDIPGIDKVTLTTNGVLLREQLPDLVAAGLDAVNISIDTLDETFYHQVTRCGSIEAVKAGLYAALAAGSLPVKINCVPVFAGKENLVSMASLARDYPVHVRFIEMMPIGLGQSFDFHSEDEIRNVLEAAYGPLTPFEGILGNGPCRYYSAPDFKGKIGFISAISHKFCSQCNRVRLTAEGYLKTCLQYDTGCDLRAPLRDGSSDDVLQQLMEKTIFEKPASHHFHEAAAEGSDGGEEGRRMYQIGG